MAITNLGTRETINAAGNGSILAYVGGIEGGASLDVSGYPSDIIPEGHPVIEADAAPGLYKVHPITGTAPNYTLAALPASHSYVGVVRYTAQTARPMVGIMNDGQLNWNAMTYKGNAAKLTEMQAAVSLKKVLIINRP